MPLPKRKLVPGILLIFMIAALAAPPLWWSQGTDPVISTTAAANNQGPANIGQAKHMVKSALDTLRPILPAVATAIEADLITPKPNPSGGTFPAILNLTVPDLKTPEWIEKQKAPLLIGQLKAIAHPFYNRLNTAAPTWLAAERTSNRTNNADSIFPWTTETTDDQNRAVANVGQLKAVFSLRFQTLPPVDPTGLDVDGDGLVDDWEIAKFGSTAAYSGTDDVEPDGANNVTEFSLGLNPLIKDHPLVGLVSVKVVSY